MAKKSKQEVAQSGAPEVRPAWEAFERGDHRTARKAAREVLAGSANDAAKAEARDVLRRTNLEPSVLIALLALGAVIAGIIIVLATRG